jgi:hypothetical protein
VPPLRERASSQKKEVLQRKLQVLVQRGQKRQAEKTKQGTALANEKGSEKSSTWKSRMSFQLTN